MRTGEPVPFFAALREAAASSPFGEVRAFEVELTRRQGKVLVLTDAGHELARIAREAIARLHDFHVRVCAPPAWWTEAAS